MKSLHCVYSGNRFADQYTLDLEGFVSFIYNDEIKTKRIK